MRRSELRRRIMNEGFVTLGYGTRHELFTKNGVEVIIPSSQGEIKKKTYIEIMKKVEQARLLDKPKEITDDAHKCDVESTSKD